MTEAGDRWPCSGRRAIFTHPILTLEQQDLTNPRTGQSHPFLVIHLPDWVSVLAITTSGDVVLVRQMRAGIAGPSVELPGGLVDPGELPEAAARREVLEETGYGGGTLTSLGWVHPNPPLQDNRCHFFLLEGVTLVAPLALDPAEDIAVSTAPLADVRAMLYDGRITHALVFAAFLRAGPVLGASSRGAP